ncbi:hypothetical protein [Streptomyces sp. 184]|uniref:hypothetical protein n=1 Tax=Streptomyces sp. 184 TaxID=1827526 RepID=UPI003891C6A8
MQRRALAQAAATAAVLAVALAGCTGSDEGSGAVDSQSGGAGASSATVPSGKYSSLPEPCTALSAGTLEELLPGAAEETAETGEDGEEALAGEPDLTYDADRQVGCRWERETTEGGHKLELQFERIVSYDGEVGDDQQAAQIYAERAEEHDVDVSSGRPELPDKTGAGDASGGTPAAGESGPSADGGADEPGSGESSAEAGGETGAEPGDESPDGSDGSEGSDGSDGSDTATDDSTDDGTDSPDDPAATIAPRMLDGIGDESFLDDVTADAGSGVQREVTVVFRTSNVVVSVTYDQWHTAGGEPPDSAELQQRAQQVADQLADQLAD